MGKILDARKPRRGLWAGATQRAGLRPGIALRVAAILVAALLGTGPASAALMTLTRLLDYRADSPNFDVVQLLTFDRFNTNLGTLNGVTVSYQVRVQDGARIEFTVEPPPVDIHFSYELAAQATLRFLDRPDIFDGTAPRAGGEFALGPDADPSFSTPLIFGDMEAIGHAGVIQFFRGDRDWDDTLAAFAIAGIGEFNVRLTAQGVLDLDSPLLGDDVIADTVGSWALPGSGASGWVTVEFLYDAFDLPDDGGGGGGGGGNQVPEPSSLLLALAGVLGLARSLRGHAQAGGGCAIERHAAHRRAAV